MTQARVLPGIGVSHGVAVGRAVLARSQFPEVPHRTVPARQVKKEIRRLRAAVNDVRRQLERIRKRAAQRAGPDEARIFDGQILMLADVQLLANVEELISEHHLTAEKAYEFKALELRDLWAKSESRLLRDRLADFNAVALRVLGHLMGRATDDLWGALGGKGPVVLVARELSASLTVELDLAQVVGLVSEEGTRTSHAAILAHSLGIPAVMGVRGALERIVSDETVVVDGTRGLVVPAPDQREIAEAQAQEARRHAHAEELATALGTPSRTVDGVEIALRSNLDLPEELDLAVAHRARGVGLVRTEFLITARTRLPTEEEQVEYFTRLAQAFPRDPIVVRSYDLGGDKFPLDVDIPVERNPFLGWRAIRVCLDQPEIFRPQIRAVLRAGAVGDVQLMIPLVTRCDEVEATRALLVEEAASLAREGVAAASSVPLGVMVETPAAAVMANRIAEVSDFLSVGTNDLTQYTLVLDRGNARLAPRFVGHDPSVLRLLKKVADAGRSTGVPVSVCGEMASDPLEAFLLMGLGYTTLSVAASSLPLIRWLVQRIPLAVARDVAAEAVAASSASAVRALARDALSRCVDLAVLDTPA